jgi:DNA-binding response OmpR family regulator
MADEIMKGSDDDRPDAAEPPVEVARRTESTPDARVYSLHLLNHDSEALLFLFDFLSNAGFRVSGSSNVRDGLDYIERERPDLVVANLEMPDLGGLDLLGRLRELSPSTRVIMTSARVDWIVYEDLLRCGGAFVAAPVKGMSLLRAVERVLGG